MAEHERIRVEALGSFSCSIRHVSMVRLQQCDGCRVQSELSGLAGLGVLDGDAASGGHCAAADPEEAAVESDVVPLQAAELGAAQAGRDGKADEYSEGGVVAVCVHED